MINDKYNRIESEAVTHARTCCWSVLPCSTIPSLLNLHLPIDLDSVGGGRSALAQNPYR